MTNPKNILILAGDTDHNLGDLAIVTATCDELRRIDRSVRISLVTSDPERDIAQLGIEPIPRGLGGLPALIKAARRADLVLCGGGGLFQDDNSLVKMPYWAIRLTILRLFCRRMVGFSIGAGPLDHALSRGFARLALRSLDSISVRDGAARSLLQPLTKRDIHVVPDPAFMLRGGHPEKARILLAEAGVPMDGRPLIGVAVRRWFHMDSDLIPHMYAAKLGLRRYRGQREMARMTARLADDLAHVASRVNGHIVFLPTYNVGHEDDVAICNAVAQGLESNQYSSIQIDEPKLYKAVTAYLSVFVCGRLHPAILAWDHGVPIVGIPYNPKFSGTFALLPSPIPCVSILDYVGDGQEPLMSAHLIAALKANSRPTGRSGAPGDKTRMYLRQLVAGEASDRGAAVSSPQRHD